MILGDFLDLHAAEARSDDPHPLDLAIKDEAQINLALERLGDLDIDPLNDLALGTRLIGDERLAEQLVCGGADIVIGLAKLDAAGLAAAPGMDLRLDRPMPAAKLRGGINGLFRAIGDGPLGVGTPKFAKISLA
jgi:hypothetical protein